MSGLLHTFGAAPTELFIGTPVRVLSSGMSRPVLFRLEDAAGEPSDWVVKAPVGRSRLPGHLIREYVGSELAAWMNVPTPAIGVLRIPDEPPETDESEVGREAAALYRDNAGLTAFCSRYVEDASVLQGMELDSLRGLHPTLIDDAIRVFVLDCLLHHHDRKRKNPNLMTHGHRLLAIDHGLAFPDLGRIDESGCAAATPPEVVARSLTEHVCRRVAKRKPDSPTWAEVEARALALDHTLLHALVQRIPDELDRSITGAPAGLKAELPVLLRTQRDQLAAILRWSREAL